MESKNKKSNETFLLVSSLFSIQCTEFGFFQTHWTGQTSDVKFSSEIETNTLVDKEEEEEEEEEEEKLGFL